MWETLVRGGVVMIPLAVGSVVGLAIALERWFSLRRVVVMKKPILDLIASVSLPADLGLARALCERNPCALAAVVKLHRSVGDPRRRENAVRAFVGADRRAQLFEIILARHSASRFPCSLHRRQQKPHQNPNNGNDHEQLDQCKTVDADTPQRADAPQWSNTAAWRGHRTEH